jgi:hypothetical protein
VPGGRLELIDAASHCNPLKFFSSAQRNHLAGQAAMLCPLASTALPPLNRRDGFELASAARINLRFFPAKRSLNESSARVCP